MITNYGWLERLPYVWCLAPGSVPHWSGLSRPRSSVGECVTVGVGGRVTVGVVTEAFTESSSSCLRYKSGSASNRRYSCSDDSSRLLRVSSKSSNTLLISLYPLLLVSVRDEMKALSTASATEALTARWMMDSNWSTRWMMDSNWSMPMCGCGMAVVAWLMESSLLLLL